MALGRMVEWRLFLFLGKHFIRAKYIFIFYWENNRVWRLTASFA